MRPRNKRQRQSEKSPICAVLPRLMWQRRLSIRVIMGNGAVWSSGQNLWSSCCVRLHRHTSREITVRKISVEIILCSRPCSIRWSISGCGGVVFFLMLSALFRRCRLLPAEKVSRQSVLKGTMLILNEWREPISS